MNAEIHAEWKRRLASGNYKKGRRALANANNEFCCLGVLCEMALDAGIVTKELDYGLYKYTSIDPEKLYDFNQHVLPTCVRDWAGLKSVSPLVNDNLVPISLINDNTVYNDFTSVLEVIDYLP